MRRNRDEQPLPHPMAPPATASAKHLHTLDKHGVFKTSLLHNRNSKVKEIESALNQRDPTDVSVMRIASALQHHSHISV